MCILKTFSELFLWVSVTCCKCSSTPLSQLTILFLSSLVDEKRKSFFDLFIFLSAIIYEKESFVPKIVMTSFYLSVTPRSYYTPRKINRSFCRAGIQHSLGQVQRQDLPPSRTQRRPLPVRPEKVYSPISLFLSPTEKDYNFT